MRHPSNFFRNSPSHKKQLLNYNFVSAEPGQADDKLNSSATNEKTSPLPRRNRSLLQQRGRRQLEPQRTKGSIELRSMQIRRRNAEREGREGEKKLRADSR